MHLIFSLVFVNVALILFREIKKLKYKPGLDEKLR